MGKKSGSGIRIRDEQPGSYFRELRRNSFGLKYLNSLDLRSGSRMDNPDHTSESLETIFLGENSVFKFFDEDPGWKTFGSGMEKF
jgi:hypothetical protein